MKNIQSITKVVAKILEIFHWIGAGLMAVVGISAVAAPSWVSRFMDTDALKTERMMDVYDFSVTVVNAAGEINPFALAMFAIGAVMIFFLVAMIFRSLNRILRNSEGGTPFQPDNIRMLRQIGIFSMSVPVVGLVMSMLIRLVVGVEAAELSVSMDGFIMGIIVLTLTQYFIYGAQLERDVDGLL